jgi:hypothetical protein
MAIRKITVHAVQIEDKPGSLHKLLAKAAADGVDLNCLSACACSGGSAMAYLSAKNPEALKACAIKAGVEVKELAGFMLTGDDTPGAAAEALKPLADAGVNGVAAAAMVCNGGYGMVVIVDASDADSAAKALGA